MDISSADKNAEAFASRESQDLEARELADCLEVVRGTLANNQNCSEETRRALESSLGCAEDVLRAALAKKGIRPGTK